MAHPMGEAKHGPLRVDFDRRLKLEFHGSQISSDGGLLPYRELDEVLGLRTSEATMKQSQTLRRKIRYAISADQPEPWSQSEDWSWSSPGLMDTH